MKSKPTKRAAVKLSVSLHQKQKIWLKLNKWFCLFLLLCDKLGAIKPLSLPTSIQTETNWLGRIIDVFIVAINTSFLTFQFSEKTSQKCFYFVLLAEDNG